MYFPSSISTVASKEETWQKFEMMMSRCKDAFYTIIQHFVCQISCTQASLYTILSSGLYYWMGLTDLANEGVFKWQTNFDEANFTFWYTDEPVSGGDDCVLLVTNFNTANFPNNNLYYSITLGLACLHFIILSYFLQYCCSALTFSGAILSATPITWWIQPRFMPFVKHPTCDTALHRWWGEKAKQHPFYVKNYKSSNDMVRVVSLVNARRLTSPEKTLRAF